MSKGRKFDIDVPTIVSLRHVGDTNKNYAFSIPIGDMFTGTTDSGKLFGTPLFIGRTTKISDMGIVVTTYQAGGLARIGIYGDNGNGQPGALIKAVAELDCSSNGLKTAAANVILSPNLYWLAFQANNSSISFRVANFLSIVFGFDNGGADGFYSPVWRMTRSYGALPDPFGTPDASQLGTAVVLAKLEKFS